MAKKSSKSPKIEKEKSQPPDNPPDKPSFKRKMKVVKKKKKKYIKMANQSLRKKLLSPSPLKSPNAPKVKKKKSQPTDKMTLKRKMQAAKKIKKKYIKMAYPKLSFRKKDKKK